MTKSALTLIRVVVMLSIGACHASNVRQLSESGEGAFEVDLAWSNDLIAVAWYDTRDGNAEIYLRLVDANGGYVSPELRLTNSVAQSYEVSVDTIEEGLAVAWYERTSSGEQHAQIGLWSNGDGLAWAKNISATFRETRNPVIRGFDNRMFCAWIEKNESGGEFVISAWWNADGSRIDEPIMLCHASQETWNLNASIDESGVAHVVYDAVVQTDAAEIFYARIDGNNVSTVRLTTDDGYSSKYPDLVYAPAGLALAWFDEKDGNREVYLYASPERELRGQIDDRSLRVTYTEGASVGAYIATSDDRIGLAWSDDTDGQYEVYFQEFQFDGLRASEPRQLSTTAIQSLIPAIEATDRGYLVAWNEVDRRSGSYHSGKIRSEIVTASVR